MNNMNLDKLDPAALDEDPADPPVQPAADDATTPAATPESDTGDSRRQPDPGVGTPTPADDEDTAPAADDEDTAPAALDEDPADPPVQPAALDPADDDEVIPGVYVEELRGRLFTALVVADGRLADPMDIPYSAELVDNPAALEAAITARLEANPRLGKYAATGDVGAGSRGGHVGGEADIIEMIREAHNR